MKSILVFTSNVINWSNIQKKKYETTSEEVLECCRMVIKCWKTNFTKQILDENLTIECEKHRDYNDLNSDNGVRTTLKVFLFSCNLNDIEEAFESISRNLVCPSFSTLILSIPKDTRIAQLLPIWQFLENKVKQNTIWRLGVTDMDLPQLEVLCKVAEIAPKINQLHNTKLCSVPQNIKNFANAKDIELLSHSDDIQDISESKLSAMLRSELSQDTNWRPRWIVKYSTIFVNRSVIRSLGYVIKATALFDNNGDIQLDSNNINGRKED